MSILEPHKLLNRNQKITEIDFNKNLIEIENSINDKSILIIGAAGSIGSAVVKKIMSRKIQWQKRLTKTLYRS